MAQITNVTVQYDRKRQPAQYESAGASVSFSAVLADDEDPVAASAELLGQAKTLVLTELGIVKAGTNASAAAQKPAQAATKPAQEAQSEAPAEAAPAAGKAQEAAEKPKTAAQKKKEAAAAKKAAEEAAKAEPTGRQISDSPEDRKAPDDDIPGEGEPTAATGGDGPDDLPEEDAPAEVQGTTAAPKPTTKEIHAFITQQIKDRKLDAPSVKEISRKFGVERIGDLKDDQLVPYLKAVKAKMGELAGNDDL